MEEYSERKKKWYLDVKRTPCAREALIWGISSGALIGLAYFAKTSVVRRSCDWAMATFVAGSLVSWEVCRYRRARKRADVKKAINIMNRVSQGEHFDTKKT